MGGTVVLPVPARTTWSSSAARVSRWPLVTSAALGAAAGAWLAWTTHAGIADDGFITLSMARNVATHGCWCVTPGLPTNTATSPLWLALLAVPMLLVGPVVALGVWLVVLTAATSAAVSAVAGRLGWSWLAGPLAAAGLVTSPILQASVGLESALAVALLAALLLAAVAERPALAGVVCGLLVLTRPDLAVVLVVALVWWRRRALLVAGAAAAVVVPWLVVSLAMFGSVVPDTLVWKQGTAGLGHASVATALPVFLTHWPADTLLELVTLLAALVVGLVVGLRRPRHPAMLLGVAGVAHLAVLVVLRVGPFVWYFAPATGAAVIGLALAAVRRPVLAGPALAVVVLAGVALTAGHDWRTQGAPFDANGALPAQYAAVAREVPTGARVETTHGEVGTIAFFCADRCEVLDPLSDPGRMAPVIGGRLASSPVLRLAYPRWHPSAPVPAQYSTRYAPTGVPVWSAYSGWSHLALVHAR